MKTQLFLLTILLKPEVCFVKAHLHNSLRLRDYEVPDIFLKSTALHRSQDIICISILWLGKVC